MQYFSTRDEAAAAVVDGAGAPRASQGSPVFAWKSKKRIGGAPSRFLIGHEAITWDQT